MYLGDRLRNDRSLRFMVCESHVQARSQSFEIRIPALCPDEENEAQVKSLAHNHRVQNPDLLRPNLYRWPTARGIQTVFHKTLRGAVKPQNSLGRRRGIQQDCSGHPPLLPPELQPHIMPLTTRVLLPKKKKKRLGSHRTEPHRN